MSALTKDKRERGIKFPARSLSAAEKAPEKISIHSVKANFGEAIDEILTTHFPKASDPAKLKQKFISDLIKAVPNLHELEHPIIRIGTFALRFLNEHTLTKDYSGNDLADRWSSLIMKTALETTRDYHKAQDITQDVCTKLWMTLDRYDPCKARASTWVLLLTKRECIDRMRRSRVRESIEGLSLDEKLSPRVGSHSSSLEQDEKLRDVTRVLASLPELQRAVVTRAYLQNQTLRQISEELETPLGTIKSALSRALVKLRELRTTEAAADNR